jgi:hypothetical protein
MTWDWDGADVSKSGSRADASVMKPPSARRGREWARRGIERDEIVAPAGSPEKDRAKAPGEGAAKRAAGRKAEASPVATESPLPTDPARFWGNGDRKPVIFEPGILPRVTAALPRRLGSFPLWRGQESFLAALDLVYRAASVRSLDLFPSCPRG